MNCMNETKPSVIYLKDYQVPEYLVQSVDLEFDLNENATLVKSRLKVIKNNQSQKTN